MNYILEAHDIHLKRSLFTYLENVDESFILCNPNIPNFNPIDLCAQSLLR